MVERKKEGKVRLRKPEVQSEKSAVSLMQDGVMVVITQAFCPNGHNLVRRDDVLFDGYPGISVFVECPEWTGEVVLSPIHGDHSKVGMSKDVPEGTRCTLRCPECEEEFPSIAKCGCESDGDLIGISLQANRANGELVGVCNVLGCYRSRVLDHWELISEFVEEDEELETV